MSEPNPGSDAAIIHGCICPVLDNAHGAGIPWPREDGLDPNEHPSFWINDRCPLHGAESRENRVKDPQQDLAC